MKSILFLLVPICLSSQCQDQAKHAGQGTEAPLPIAAEGDTKVNQQRKALIRSLIDDKRYSTTVEGSRLVITCMDTTLYLHINDYRKRYIDTAMVRIGGLLCSHPKVNLKEISSFAMRVILTGNDARYSHTFMEFVYPYPAVFVNADSASLPIMTPGGY